MLRIPIAIAALKLLIHFMVNGRYGYFRDELYYLACAEHLDLGYVDHPPLSIFLLAGVRAALGDSLFAIRFLPAVAGALLVFLTGVFVRRLGGGRFAQLVACLCVLIAPVYLTTHNFYSMNAFEPLSWTLAALVLVAVIQSNNAKLWLVFGLIAGLSLQSKHSMLFFGFGAFVGLLLTPHRKLLLSPWLWAGASLALLLFLSNVIWQIAHGFPTVEFMRNAQQYKNLPVSPLEFFTGQILIAHPLAFPVWLAGLAYLFFGERGRYRLLGWIYIAVFALFVLQRAKIYYLSPIYPTLLAAGALAIERLTARGGARWARSVAVALLAIGGTVMASLVLPVLPVETYVRYYRMLQPPSLTSERHESPELPQTLADMFGWPEMVAEVAGVFERFAPDERADAAIFTSNYGQAGAIDFFGAKYGLPKAVSGHNSYWLWGPRDYSGRIVITVGIPEEDLRPFFEEVELAATVRCRYCMPHENGKPIHIARKPKRPLPEIWPEVKRYV